MWRDVSVRHIGVRMFERIPFLDWIGHIGVRDVDEIVAIERPSVSEAGAIIVDNASGMMRMSGQAELPCERCNVIVVGTTIGDPCERRKVSVSTTIREIHECRQVVVRVIAGVVARVIVVGRDNAVITGLVLVSKSGIAGRRFMLSRNRTMRSVTLKCADNGRVGLAEKRRGRIEWVQEMDGNFARSVGIQADDDMRGFE